MTPADAAAHDQSALATYGIRTESQQHMAFMRKLRRLRHAIELSEDPGDLFEATSQYIHAITVIGSCALVSSSSRPASTDTRAPARYEVQHHHGSTARPLNQPERQLQMEGDNLLAVILTVLLRRCSRRGSDVRTPAVPLAHPVGPARPSYPTDCSQVRVGSDTPASGSRHQHVSLLSNSSATTTATAQPLQQTYSIPPDFMQGVGSPSTDSSGGGTSAGGLLRSSNSNSAVQTDVPSSHLQHAARLSHTCTQAPNAQHAHQNLQPTLSDKDSLYHLLCQQLQASAKPCVKELGGIKAPVPQYAAPPRQQLQQQQQASADSDERKAVLLHRLKQAMAWNSAQYCRKTQQRM